jgi:hypothetical protein
MRNQGLGGLQGGYLHVDPLGKEFRTAFRNDFTG